jgi:hypothetical protein
MTEAAADRLTPARAAELVQILDLQSRWENLRAAGSPTTAQLHGLQAAFEAYRIRMAAYTARNQGEPVPELTPTKPGRLGAWCRTVRAVLRRAGGCDCPAHIVAKAHRVADQIAGRLEAEPVGRERPTDMAGALGQLDRVIAWCERLADVTRSVVGGGAHEVGGPAAGGKGA